MKIHCCYTPVHRILLEECFLPTVPADFTVEATPVDLAGVGDFRSTEYLDCLREKMRLVLKSLEEQPDEVLVWSDVDIQFFGLSREALLRDLGDHDLAYQREGPRVTHINGGFFVCRSTAQTRAFYREINERLARQRDRDDQSVINELFEETPPRVRWTHLPLSYYARTHGWPPPRALTLYHANETVGPDAVGQKIRQFREVAFIRKFGPPALLLTCLKYVPKRLKRLAAETWARR